MRHLILGIFLVVLLPDTSAAIFKCVGNDGAVTFQATPCQGQIKRKKPLVVEVVPEPAGGYNLECTHYNGRRVLDLKQMSDLYEAEQEKYLDWLLSDAGPQDGEKDACLVRLEREEFAQPLVQADTNTQDSADPEDTDSAASDADAVEMYSLSRIIKTEVDMCKGINSKSGQQAQDALDGLIKSNASKIRDGERLAKTGIRVEGESISPQKIADDIRNEQEEIRQEYATVTPANRSTFVEKCEAMPFMIGLVGSLALSD